MTVAAPFNMLRMFRSGYDCTTTDTLARRPPLGRVSIEVIEPMQSLRIRVAPNEFGLEADLVFRARTVALEEPRFVHRVENRIVMDSTRFAQFGHWEGWLSVGGKRIEVAAQQTLGTRDRSWGVRPVGEPGQEATDASHADADDQRQDVEVTGAALDRLDWQPDAPAFPGDSAGSLTALYDSSLAAGQFGFRLPGSFSEDDVFSAGAAFVMRDPDDPAARHEAIVDDAGLRSVLDDLPEASDDETALPDAPHLE